jgi:hypothetical protein
MAAPAMSFQVSPKDIENVHKKLARIKGKPLGLKLQRATLAAADLLVPSIKAATPKLGHTSYIEGSSFTDGRKAKRGLLRRSVKARTATKRLPGGFLAPTYGALVGPTAPHRHFIIQGTKERFVVPKDKHAGTKLISFPNKSVARAGFSAGRMTPDPFVDRAARGHEKKAAAIIKREWFGDWSKP